MSDFANMLDDVAEMAEKVIRQADRVPARELGLDSRCGTLYVTDEFVATDLHNQRMLEYYGGFEYVPRDLVNVVGDYVFYVQGDDRVDEVIDQRSTECFYAQLLPTEEV
jgi:hypothetical protein